MLLAWGQTSGQGWPQVADLGVAFGLSMLIGAEREIRQKAAGLRTHTLVGVGAALFMLVSKYGFGDLLGGHVVLDPSRIAAQIVSGIGFIGGGLIFVRQDIVRGLTTAAVVWLTAAIGMTAGAGLPLLAVLATAAHFVVVLVLPPLARRLPRSRWEPARLRLDYVDGRGVLRRALAECTARGFTVVELDTARTGARTAAGDSPSIVSLDLRVRGSGPVAHLAAELAEVDGVVAVVAGDGDEPAD